MRISTKVSSTLLMTHWTMNDEHRITEALRNVTNKINHTEVIYRNFTWCFDFLPCFSTFKKCFKNWITVFVAWNEKKRLKMFSNYLNVNESSVEGEKFNQTRKKRVATQKQSFKNSVLKKTHVYCISQNNHQKSLKNHLKNVRIRRPFANFYWLLFSLWMTKMSNESIHQSYSQEKKGLKETCSKKKDWFTNVSFHCDSTPERISRQQKKRLKFDGLFDERLK